MFYITGDTHAQFGRIEQFCERICPTREDVLIILGDAGINYYGGWRDWKLKRRLAELPLTLFSIHGNHEQRPMTIAVAYGYNAEGGTQNYRFSTYQDVSELEEAIRLVKGYRKRNSGYFFRAESFFNVATVTNLQYNDDGRLPDYHAQSHGESFLSFLQDEAREGVYLMDEPEAALSPQRQLTLMRHIYYMAMEGSQFIIATHSPILLGLPGAQILNFSDEGIRPICYEDTESYQITKLFLERRRQMLEELFKDVEE